MSILSQLQHRLRVGQTELFELVGAEPQAGGERHGQGDGAEGLIKAEAARAQRLGTRRLPGIQRGKHEPFGRWAQAKSCGGVGQPATLPEAWQAWEASGQEVWQQMDGVVTMLDGLVGEETFTDVVKEK